MEGHPVKLNQSNCLRIVPGGVHSTSVPPMLTRINPSLFRQASTVPVGIGYRNGIPYCAVRQYVIHAWNTTNTTHHRAEWRSYTTGFCTDYGIQRVSYTLFRNRDLILRDQHRFPGSLTAHCMPIHYRIIR